MQIVVFFVMMLHWLKNQLIKVLVLLFSKAFITPLWTLKKEENATASPFLFWYIDQELLFGSLNHSSSAEFFVILFRISYYIKTVKSFSN